MIFAALAMTFMAAAQTVESSKLLENTYVTVLGGGATSTVLGETVTPFFWDGAKQVVKGVRPLAGVEFGKYITPVVGFGVEALAFFGTTGSHTFVDQSNLLLNGKLNFSNWFGGYPGQPRRVEVVGVAGLGWGHDYGEPRIDPNYVVYNTGAEVNVNLGKERAWQITVRPGVLWNNYDNNPKFNWGTDARLNLQVGAVYKFGSKPKKSHNFVLCPYSVTAADYAAAKARIAELEAQGPKVVEKEVTKEVTKEVVKVEVKYSVLPLTVKFKIGSSQLNAAAKENISDYVDMIPENCQVVIVGSADTKTGSANRNDTLAKQRAEVVAAELRKNGVKNIVTKSALDVDDNPAQSRVAIIEVSE